MCMCDAVMLNCKSNTVKPDWPWFCVFTVNFHKMQFSGNVAPPTEPEPIWIPAGRESCRASVRAPPAHCCASAAGSARSLDHEPAPAHAARPRAAWWRWPPPARPGSAPPAAAARRTRASCPPAPSGRWPVRKGASTATVHHFETPPADTVVKELLFSSY